MVKYSLIAAFSENFVIGNGLKIPWYISEDFKHFKETTLNSVIIMGKNTWDSLPIKPLPNRINIVLCNKKINIENAIVCNSIKEALDKAELYNKKIFVIGGASIYNQTIKNATYLYISHVKGNYEGNVFFPKFDYKNYEILEEKDYDKFIFKKYKKL